MGRLPFYNTCVGWRPDQMDALHHLCDYGREIKRATFRKHVARDELDDIERSLGYNRAIRMKNDYTVRYYRCGVVYYFIWSAIEHVFATPEMIRSLTPG
jgi:hypothetical protein